MNHSKKCVASMQLKVGRSNPRCSFKFVWINRAFIINTAIFKEFSRLRCAATNFEVQIRSKIELDRNHCKK